MAVTQGSITGVSSLKQLDSEILTLAFTSTTATVEATTGLSEVYGMTYHRHGSGGANQAELQLDETHTSGVVTPASGVVTIDRTLSDAAGTLGAESYTVILYGKS